MPVVSPDLNRFPSENNDATLMRAFRIVESALHVPNFNAVPFVHVAGQGDGLC
jgi:hypothetical protein